MKFIALKVRGFKPFFETNKEVKQENIRGQSEVDVSSLTNGIYFVTLTKESGEFVGGKKLLIIK